MEEKLQVQNLQALSSLVDTKELKDVVVAQLKRQNRKNILHKYSKYFILKETGGCYRGSAEKMASLIRIVKISKDRLKESQVNYVKSALSILLILNLVLRGEKILEKENSWLD